MDQRNQILLASLSLEEGERMRMVCPFCNATHETSLMLTRHAEGLGYRCWRAKCGQSGLIRSKGSPNWGKQEKRKKSVKVFDYETYELPPSFKRMYLEKYLITEEELDKNGFVYAPESNRVIMPIYNALGYETGKVARSYAADCSGSKAISYFEDGNRHLHYVPYSGEQRDRIVCVEDIPSAIRVARFGRACALLGSELDDSTIDDLAKQTDYVVMALDPDATHKALKMKKRYALYFKQFDVRILSSDPKDASDEQILEEIFR